MKFTMLVGLPASGKSTYAKKLKEETGAIVLSSDDLREELFEDVNCQDRNSELFEEMNRRAKMALKIGKDVIYDATNINSKRRKALLSQLPKNIQKECVYMNEDGFNCVLIDAHRERKVGADVIRGMYKNLQIPMYYEGWDRIIIHNSPKKIKNHIEIPSYYEEYCSLLKELKCEKCIDMPQDTPYHTLSVSRHMYYTYEKLLNDGASLSVLMAGMLHDIGKPYCKEFVNRYARFTGHDNVSAQLTIGILKNTPMTDDEIIHVATLIQLHMRLHNKEWGSKSKDKFRREIGEGIYQQLLELNNADSLAK